jgi:hypothetical protein
MQYKKSIRQNSRMAIGFAASHVPAADAKELSQIGGIKMHEGLAGPGTRETTSTILQYGVSKRCLCLAHAEIKVEATP